MQARAKFCFTMYCLNLISCHEDLSASFASFYFGEGCTSCKVLLLLLALKLLFEPTHFNGVVPMTPCQAQTLVAWRTSQSFTVHSDLRKLTLRNVFIGPCLVTSLSYAELAACVLP